MPVRGPISELPAAALDSVGDELDLEGRRPLFVGWDWGSTAHDVTVIDSAGDRVHRMAIPHTEDGIARAVATLADYGDPGELPVAIETARGLVVDRLPETLELQALTRQRDNRLALRIAAVSQLAALLDQHWPGGKTIFAQLHSPIALDFLHRYPTPQAAASLTPARIEAFCRRRGYSGRRSGAELLERLRSAPVSASRLGEPY